MITKVRKEGLCAECLAHVKIAALAVNCQDASHPDKDDTNSRYNSILPFDHFFFYFKYLLFFYWLYL